MENLKMLNTLNDTLHYKKHLIIWTRELLISNCALLHTRDCLTQHTHTENLFFVDKFLQIWKYYICFYTCALRCLYITPN